MFIDFNFLEEQTEAVKHNFNSKHPFRYTVIENFFLADKAVQILNAYPTIKEGNWNGTTYINQKNKFTQNQFETDVLFIDVFAELNSPRFVNWLQCITGIQNISADTQLYGAGLHQSVNGAFLNVHLDFNLHPATKFHRRINLLIYMNPDWKEEYGGHLEFWNVENDVKKHLMSISPTFNRCVIFEINSKSFHGHPKPLNTPEGVSRKSLAAYYYTPEPPKGKVLVSDKTVYVNTDGLYGYLKQLASGAKAFLERLIK